MTFSIKCRQQINKSRTIAFLCKGEDGLTAFRPSSGRAKLRISVIALVAMGAMAACASPTRGDSNDDQAISTTEHDLEAKAPVSRIVKSDQANVVSKIGSDSVVRFYYSLDGTLVEYEKNYEGDVVAHATVPGKTYQLSLHRSDESRDIELGYLVDGKLRVCGDQEIDGKKKTFSCDALFLHSNEKTPSMRNPEQRFPVIIGYSDVPAAPEDTKLGTKTFALETYSDTIDLQQWALPQINQYGTGTCYFNSATGILEWFYNKKTGTRADFSEPGLLGVYAIGELGSSIGDYSIMDSTRLLETVIPNAWMPVTDYYTSSVGFDAVYASARSAVRSVPASARVALPFKLSTERLFWYGKWQKGYTTESDYQKAVQWITQRRRPVHLQHVVNGYWHAVIMLGHKPATGEVLIKDSLGSTSMKASWRPKSWFINNTYGAVGVIEDGDTGEHDDSTAGQDVVCPRVPLSCDDIGKDQTRQFYGCCLGVTAYWCDNRNGTDSWKLQRHDCAVEGQACGATSDKGMYCIDYR